MAVKTWEPLASRFCHHVAQQVLLEVEVVYPADFIPEITPRVLAHRCSRGTECSQQDKISCMWSGTNPTFDPFLEAI